MGRGTRGSHGVSEEQRLIISLNCGEGSRECHSVSNQVFGTIDFEQRRNGTQVKVIYSRCGGSLKSAGFALTHGGLHSNLGQLGWQSSLNFWSACASCGAAVVR